MRMLSSAAKEGAAVANKVEVVSLLKDSNDRVSGARVRDLIAGEEWDIKAKTVVNACGPFVGTQF